LHVNVKVIPERKWCVLLVCLRQVIDPSLSEFFHTLVVDLLKVIDAAAFMLCTEVNGQEPSLAAVGDQPFRGVKVAFGQPMFFEDVSPAAG
jgi:hypothetical protein